MLGSKAKKDLAAAVTVGTEGETATVEGIEEVVTVGTEGAVATVVETEGAVAATVEETEEAEAAVEAADGNNKFTCIRK